jgi:glycerol-3-phosphate acyltransferase PlsY
MSPATGHVIALAFGYLLGSIPFGLILTRLAGTQDIRAIGSGNIGATNVLRTGHKSLAAATLIADMLKGTAAALAMAWLYGRDAGMVAGLGAFIGHLFPVWLKFKGGKGVATFLGVLLALAWQGALLFGVLWVAIAAATRFASLASLVACAATPIYFWIVGAPHEAGLFFVLTVLAVIMHRGNIARLAQGREGKIGEKAAAKPAGG